KYAAVTSGVPVLLLARDPVVHARRKHVQRKSAGAEHCVVERANVEGASEFLLSAGAQLQDLQLPHHVGKRLARVRNVTVRLALDLDLVDGGVLMEEIDDLLARPLLRVQAGVDHEPDGAQHLVLKPPEVAVRIAIEADLLSETLGIERPAFDERRVEGLLTHGRKPFELLSD